MASFEIFQGIYNYIKKCDYFGKPVMLTLNKKPSYKTFLGGFITVFIVAFCIGMSYGYIRALIYGEDPNFVFQETKNYYTPMLNLNNSNMFIGFRVEDAYGNLVPNDPSKFEIVFSYIAYARTETGTSLLQMYYEEGLINKKCTKENTNGNATLLYRESLDDYYCMDFSKNYLIGGEWRGQAFSNFIIRLKKCNKFTEQKYGVTCDQNFFNRNRYWFASKTLRYVINPYDHYYMKQKTSTYVYRTIEETFKKSALMRFSRLNVTDDYGIISSNEIITSDIFVDNIFNDIHKSDLDYNKGGADDNNLFYIVINLSDKVYSCRRFFNRIQDLVSTMGGFMGLICFAIEGLYKMYLYFDYRDYLFNSLFDFYLKPSEEEEKNYVPKKTFIVAQDLSGDKQITSKEAQDKFHSEMLKIKTKLDEEDEGIKKKKTHFSQDANVNGIDTKADQLVKGLRPSVVVEEFELENVSDKKPLKLLSQDVAELAPGGSGGADGEYVPLDDNNQPIETPSSDHSKASDFTRKIDELTNLNIQLDERTMTKIKNRRSTNFIKGIEQFKMRQELYQTVPIKFIRLFQYKFCFCEMKKIDDNASKIKQVIKLAQLEVYKKTDLRYLLKHSEQVHLLKKIVLNKPQTYMLDNKEKLMIYNKFECLEDMNDKVLDVKLKEVEKEKLAGLIDYLKKRKEHELLDSTDLILFENLSKDVKKEVISEVNL